jgi:hypothetical protein
MIGDVLDWIEKNKTPLSYELDLIDRHYCIDIDRQGIFDLRTNNRKSISEQSIECIEYVFSLIK